MRESETPTAPETLAGESVAVGDIEPDSIARARSTLADAESWRRENPRLYGLLEEWALAEVGAGRSFSSRELVERLRWHGMSLSDAKGRSVRVANDLAAVLTRWLVAEHPEVRSHVVMRRSPLDAVMEECNRSKLR